MPSKEKASTKLKIKGWGAHWGQVWLGGKEGDMAGYHDKHMNSHTDYQIKKHNRNNKVNHKYQDKSKLSVIKQHKNKI